LSYPVVAEYPKTDKTMYDDGPMLSVRNHDTQMGLF